MEIAIERVTMQYGRVRALEEVTLHIRGGMFGLLGPNGAGKTTLMRLITAQLKPTAGRIAIGGVDVAREPGWVRQRIGYLPQEFGFYGSLTALELLDYIAVMKNIPPQRRRREVEEALEAVNLTRVARRRVGTFSGGMKQRLGIAQALLGDPPVLVVDEPTAGLDPEERIRFRNLLARLSAHRTVLLSTHVVADVEASCTALALLSRGRVLFTGSPAALQEQARGRVWSLEVPAAELERVAAMGRVVSSRMQGDAVLLRVHAPEPPLGRAVPQEPTLEDGYLAVMDRAAGPDEAATLSGAAAGRGGGRA